MTERDIEMNLNTNKMEHTKGKKISKSGNRDFDLQMMDNKEKLSKIAKWQNNDNGRELTCENNSPHLPLIGKEVDGKVILVCLECDYDQEYIPEIIFIATNTKQDDERDIEMNLNTKKMKHTEGEWDCKAGIKIPTENGDIEIHNNKKFSKWVATVKGCQIPPEEQIANAKLIAAAPDMLKTLEEIAKGEGRYDMDKLKHASNTIEDMIKIANEAIKKATE